ncbi:hypothetical protein E2C01_071328 [Portunus trituberculatus]|uniref:Uncharacterized protein n=1 Tax=Portunus trituberculatus TaxID=210409 RepID=A0A5B7I3N7_PORTR|nr:hypothetical protein [Portunus trituberculatus]
MRNRSHCHTANVSSACLNSQSCDLRVYHLSRSLRLPKEARTWIERKRKTVEVNGSYLTDYLLCFTLRHLGFLAAKPSAKLVTLDSNSGVIDDLSIATSG